jgi:hypothetical protein
MPSDVRHPSAFELDVFFVDGKCGDEGVESHLEACVRCRRYVEELERWANEPLRSKWAVPPWMTTAAGALVLTAITVLAARSFGTEHETRRVEKTAGAPGIEVLLRRERISIWDGRSPLESGDTVALRMDCRGFSEVTLAVEENEVGWQPLFEGVCPPDGQPLRFALVPDDKPGQKHVAVVFRNQKLDGAALASAVRNVTRTSDAWTIDLDFERAGSR